MTASFFYGNGYRMRKGVLTSMSLKLKSGFTFDYDNLYGEGKVTDADLKSYEEDLKKAHEAMKVMRDKGFIKAHLSKDGEPEKVLFSELPYIEEGPSEQPELHETSAGTDGSCQG
jgi:hypothetical protein